MREYFADLHIHLGRTHKGQAVKITASRQLTFSNIIEEASVRKGLDMIGIIDMHSPQVLEEVERKMAEGSLQELPGGGLRYRGTVIILGSEVELRFERLGCTAHFLVYLPSLQNMKEFSAWLSQRVKNIHLSTQRLYATMAELQDVVQRGEGLLIPAHIFTPFKSVYGNCTDSMVELMDTGSIPAVELGLSADTEMADCLRELRDKTFLTNSDAHSLAKIAREYQKIRMAECSFNEWKKALWREDGRQITANYGLNPKLGKYHVTRCASCDALIEDEIADRCPSCGCPQLVKGVLNRLRQISDTPAPIHPEHRPPYIHQVPLEFIPKLGPKKMKELLHRFHTEMNILHHVPESDLADAAGPDIAAWIMKNRTGDVQFEVGGGGKYGKILTP